MLGILIDVVLPVFVMAGVGVLVGRTLKLDARPISRLALYIFSPALIFSSLSTADISLREIWNIFSYLALWLPLLLRGVLVDSLADAAERSSQSCLSAGNHVHERRELRFASILVCLWRGRVASGLLFLAPQALLSGTLAIYVASSGTASGIRHNAFLRIVSLLCPLGVHR